MADLAAFPITRRWPATHPDRLQLYSLPTPNGVKVSIMLEEIGLPYEPHRIDFDKNEQQTPEFLSLNPNGKIPAIIDPNGPSGAPLGLFESGAILLYLADKTGKFMPKDPDGYWVAMQWLMWQMGGVGPMIGQVHHFLRNAKGKAPYAEERYSKEAHRLYRVLDKRLGEAEYLAGAYSIADMATWPWISRFEWHQVDIAKYANVLRWYKAIAARPAVVKGYHVPVKQPGIPMPA